MMFESECRMCDDDTLSSLNASLTELDDSLTASDNHKFEFMTDGDGNYGYRGADDSFVPFSSGVVKGFLCGCYYDKTMLCINTDGTITTPTMTHQSTITTDFITGSIWVNYIQTPTVLKAGYYMVVSSDAITTLSASYYDVNDTLPNVTMGISAGGGGSLIYFGETNPFA